MNFFFIWLDSVYLVCTQHKMGVYSIFIIEWLFDSFSSFDHKKIKTSRILLICRKNSLILPFWWNRNNSPYSLIYYSICMKSNILFGWNPIGFQYFLLSKRKNLSRRSYLFFISFFLMSLFLCYFVLYNSVVCGIIFSRELMKRIIEWIAIYA